jgi:hypothetical protein
VPVGGIVNVGVSVGVVVLVGVWVWAKVVDKITMSYWVEELLMTLVSSQEDKLRTPMRIKVINTHLIHLI